MFHLLKILNGRSGVPEPERIVLSTATSVTYGMPVSVKGGILTKMSLTASTLPTHLILANSTDKEILAAPITEEMLFEVPLAASPAAMTEGTEYLIAADGLTLSATVATSDKRGALLVNKNGAFAAGDRVTVRFKN